jgi:nicotinic acetylcholine receptor
MKKIMSIFITLIIHLIHFGCILVTAAKHNNYNYEQMLIDKLISNYNKNLRPPQGTVQIKFSLNLNQIINLIEKDQIILINAFIDHEWIDKRLSWDPSDYGNLSLIRISGEKVWT